MIISPTNKFVFFKPIKTAGSSVEFALALSCGPDDLLVGGMKGAEQEAGFLQQNNVIIDKKNKTIDKLFHSHATPINIRKRFNTTDIKEVEDFTWITMTRNPWDMLVSFYWWSISRKPEINKHVTINDNDSKKTAHEKFNNLIFTSKSKMAGTEPNIVEFMTSCQYVRKYTLQLLDEKMDYYIRFENIEQDFEHVVDTLGLYNVELPRFKTTHKKLKKHYSYYYTNETKQIVAEGFKDYIEKFDYKFEWKDKRLSRRERANRRRNKK
jgi:hypothetical protein